MLRLPRNCSEVQIALPGAPDGHYTLDIEGQPGVIFCHLMNTSTPQAYITLHHLNRFDRHFHGTGRTYFQKVAVNLKVSSFLSCFYPSEEFELRTNSLGAHIETHGKFILRTLSYLTEN